ncbi:MAG: hypothetical protein ABW007_02730 [Chitinophagaceae bacterium]
MVRNVKIDFGNRYDLRQITEDFRNSEFTTVLRDGKIVPVYIQISNESHELMPDVYNMAFGPLKGNRIDDKAELAHFDHSKVFSTILFNAWNYLIENPTHSVGFDGSDYRRARLYYQILQKNFEYLNERLILSGLKYYVRITRFGKMQYDNPFDFADIIPGIATIKKEIELPWDQMFNYFIFKLKN